MYGGVAGKTREGFPMPIPVTMLFQEAENSLPLFTAMPMFSKILMS